MVLNWLEDGVPPLAGSRRRKRFCFHIANARARRQAGGGIEAIWSHGGCETEFHASADRPEA